MGDHGEMGTWWYVIYIYIYIWSIHLFISPLSLSYNLYWSGYVAYIYIFMIILSSFLAHTCTYTNHSNLLIIYVYTYNLFFYITTLSIIIIIYSKKNFIYFLIFYFPANIQVNILYARVTMGNSQSGALLGPSRFRSLLLITLMILLLPPLPQKI